MSETATAEYVGKASTDEQALTEAVNVVKGALGALGPVTVSEEDPTGAVFIGLDHDHSGTPISVQVNITP